MLYTPRKVDPRDPDGFLFDSLEPVINGMGMSLIELNVYRSKVSRKEPSNRPIREEKGAKVGRVQVRAVVYGKGITGVDECSRVHRGIMPRLELTFPERDIYLEVSSPGIDRIIKDGSEFVHYIGRGIKCYRTDISDWSSGILCTADEKKIVLRGEGGEITLPYEVIAKARLDEAAPYNAGG